MVVPLPAYSPDPVRALATEAGICGLWTGTGNGYGYGYEHRFVERDGAIAGPGLFVYAVRGM